MGEGWGHNGGEDEFLCGCCNVLVPFYLEPITLTTFQLVANPNPPIPLGTHTGQNFRLAHGYPWRENILNCGLKVGALWW